MKKRAHEEMVPIQQIYSQEIVIVRVNNPDMEIGHYYKASILVYIVSVQKITKNYE